jgi:hypothetical protein
MVGVVGGTALVVPTLVLALLLASPARATVPYHFGQLALSTPWTHSVSRSAPLPSYPRPQLERARWLSLNGRWQYQQAPPGQGPPFHRSLAQTILVPFPVQSPLSGIERGDTHGWYRRLFTVPAGWKGQHVLLNFGAVSWMAHVYVNGRSAGVHRGDYDAFSFDITRLLHAHGPNELVVGFSDPIGGADEPVGKQVPGTPGGVSHTASSGIWQTVWLEPVSAEHLARLDLTPDLARRRLVVETALSGSAAGLEVAAQALSGGRVVATATGRPGRPFPLRIPHPRLWSPSSPYLYGLELQLIYRSARRGRRAPAVTVLDRVRSYFGMRSISLSRTGGVTRILLNGKFVFQTGALDQGYWPDGLYTAPSDAALRRDISAAKDLGYDMLREHEKIQDDRWYYWADRLGILVWQDMPSLPFTQHQAPTAFGRAEFRRELRAIVTQHRSDPSIVMWIPFNEGWGQFDPAQITRQIKHLDPSRLVDADSGSANCCHAILARGSDVLDTHLYFGPFGLLADRRASVIGEYGGMLPFPPPGHAWPGVLTSIGSPALPWPLGIIDPFLGQQYAELTQEMRARGLSGAVFTELANYEQELGILSYDRSVFTMPPAFVRHLNRSLIGASQRRDQLRSPRASVPGGTTGLWQFNEAGGTTAGDASGHGHALTLQQGAGWTRGLHGGALAVGGIGQSAITSVPVIDSTNSFTVSAWLEPFRSGQSGTAVSEPGPVGSSFSLGIDTATQGRQSLGGVTGARARLPLGSATWWTFAVPATPTCPAWQCGVRANMRYDDGRYDPHPGNWHQVTGVYSRATQTIVVYVDGAPEDVEHVDGVPAATGPLTVGAGNGDYSPTDTFIGAIDELRVYGRALSPLEADQLYQASRRR